MTSNFVKHGKKVAGKAASRLVQDAIRERDKTLSRADNGKPRKKKDDPVDEIVRMAAAGIGVVSEALHHRREKKRAHREDDTRDPQHLENAANSDQVSQGVAELEPSEQEIAPQEPQGPGEPRKADSQSTKKPVDLAQAFLQRHSHHSSANSVRKVTLPVVLPQRRPKTRARGFVRAYAPVLADAGIDQETFIDFIDSFNKALEPNPWLYAINLAGLAAEAAPDPFTILIGAGIDIASDAIIEMQSRFRSNKFLGRVNEEFFIPHGTICLVVTWDPDASDEELITAVDFEGKAKRSFASADFAQNVKGMMMQKVSSKEELKKTREEMQEMAKAATGAFQCSEPAPLVFPSPDSVAAKQDKDDGGKRKTQLDRAEEWLDEYMDRRAQTKWIAKNPDLPMASQLPRPEYQSRFADPNHPASRGDIVALLTGGHWQYGQENSAGGGNSRDDGRHEPEKDGDSNRPDPRVQRTKSKTSKIKSGGGLTSLLQRDVVYLLIVSIPSQGRADQEVDGTSMA